nr:uncharacterized protein LOC104646862 [Solanum lycopersicum]
MHGHDLYDHLDGSAPCHSRTITTGTITSANPVFSLWFRQDQLIQNTLMASLDQTIAVNKSQTRIFSLPDRLAIPWDFRFNPARDSTITYEELTKSYEDFKTTPNQITAAAATSTKSGYPDSRHHRRSNNGTGSNQQWQSNNCFPTPNQCHSSLTTNSYDGVHCQL